MAYDENRVWQPPRRERPPLISYDEWKKTQRREEPIPAAPVVSPEPIPEPERPNLLQRIIGGIGNLLGRTAQVEAPQMPDPIMQGTLQTIEATRREPSPPQPAPYIPDPIMQGTLDTLSRIPISEPRPAPQIPQALLDAYAGLRSASTQTEIPIREPRPGMIQPLTSDVVREIQAASQPVQPVGREGANAVLEALMNIGRGSLEAGQYLSSGFSRTSGLADIAAGAARLAGRELPREWDLVKEIEEREVLPEGAARAYEFAGQILGTIPLIAGAGATGIPRAVGAGAEALLRRAPQWAQRAGRAVASAGTIGTMVGGIQQAASEFARPEEATARERLAEVAKTAAYYGAYGLAYPWAQRVVSAAWNHLPSNVQRLLTRAYERSPFASIVAEESLKGAIAGTIVGGGIGAFELARTGDPQKAWEAVYGEAGEEAAENFVESIAFTLARALSPRSPVSGGPDVVASIKNNAIETMPDDLKNVFNETIEQAKERGLSEQDAEDVAFDVVSSDPRGEEVVRRAAANVIDSITSEEEAEQVGVQAPYDEPPAEQVEAAPDAVEEQPARAEVEPAPAAPQEGAETAPQAEATTEEQAAETQTEAETQPETMPHDYRVGEMVRIRGFRDPAEVIGVSPNRIRVRRTSNGKELEVGLPAILGRVEEATPAVEAAPAAEMAPAVEAAPAAEMAPAVETAPAAEMAPAVEAAPAAEMTPAVEAAPAAETTATAEQPTVKHRDRSFRRIPQEVTIRDGVVTVQPYAQRRKLTPYSFNLDEYLDRSRRHANPAYAQREFLARVGNQERTAEEANAQDIWEGIFHPDWVLDSQLRAVNAAIEKMRAATTEQEAQPIAEGQPAPAEPAARPTVETTEPTAEEPTTEPTTEPATEPTAESTTEPEAEPATPRVVRIGINHQPSGGKEWAAEITGRHPRFKFNREFLDPVERDWSSSGKTGTTYFELEEGKLYDVNEPWKKRYFATVRNGEVVRLSEAEVLEALQQRTTPSQVEPQAGVEPAQAEPTVEEAVEEGGETDVRTDAVGDVSGETLEGTPPEDVRGTEEAGPVEESPVRGARTDEGGVARPDRPRGTPADGVGIGEGGVDSPARRGDTADTRGTAGAVGTTAGGRITEPGGRNYVIQSLDEIGMKGKKTSFRNNIEAIKTLKQVESEGRPATPEEQQKLVKYVGFGGLPEAFSFNRDWEKEAKELRDLLTTEEYKSVRATVNNAHYTSGEIIQEMYKGLERLGFDGGRLLEPSMGIGHFFGLMPRELASKVRATGVEIDNITGRIAKLLYPQYDVRIQGFEETNIPDNFFDVAIGNVPFGNYRVYDKKYLKTGMTGAIHNYFFAKSLDKVRPGGIVMFITSRYTMDAKNNAVRKYISDRADLIGAIRLPDTAFKQSAQTDVVTDILILKKREEGQQPSDVRWLESVEHTLSDGSVKNINEYFVQHPEMVMGKFVSERGMYGPDELTVKFDGNLQEAVERAFNRLPENVYERPKHKATEEVTVEQMIPAPGEAKDNAYVIVDGKVFINQGGNLVQGRVYQPKQIERIKGMIEIRDAARDVLRKQLDPNTTEDELKQAQGTLNKVYDAFVKKYGYLNDRVNKSLFSDDPDSYFLLSLENYEKEDSRKATGTATKADIFSKRTIERYEPVQQVETAEEALIVSLNETGMVDLDRIASLTGQTVEEAQEALRGLIYLDPQNGWKTSDDYLSGNVRAKLKIAESAAQNDPAYKVNVEALRKVIPEDIPAEQIVVNIGAPWVGARYTQDFVREVLDNRAAEVIYVEEAAEWKLTVPRGSHRSQKYATQRVPAERIIEYTLNGRAIKVYDKTDDERYIVNSKETLAAREKQDELRQAFKEWIWKDEKRKEALHRKYNDEFNSIRLRQYDGSHLTFPGMNKTFLHGGDLAPHQKNAVWRVMQGGNSLLAHSVGAGKTFEMIAAAMELKRIGIVKKPMFVVPNNMVEQFGDDFMKLYPAANILVPKKKDFEAANRKKMMARIATGDWDGVIVAHSSFGHIPVTRESMEAVFEQQLQELEAAIVAEKGTTNETRTVKRLEAAKKNLEARMKEQANRLEKDKDNVFFEELGVDALFVDEAHEFKNLFYVTRLQNVAGLGDRKGAGKAFDLLAKVRYLQRLNGGRGVVFATGTPISNSLVEMYTMQRYLQPKALEDLGIHSFDAWKDTFGEVVNTVELAPEGKGYRTRQRLAKAVNLPELQSLFRSFADVQTAEELLKKGLIKRPKLAGGKRKVIQIEPTDELIEYVEELGERAEEIRKGNVNPSEDNMLKVTTDGRKAALDMRLIDPSLPDNPQSKVNVVARNVKDIWERTKDKRSTQIIFLDISAPKERTSEEEEADAPQQDIVIYDELKRKLINQGVPEKEIAIIHDYKTDTQIHNLYQEMNEGKVRILLGSTQKMGVGMNVQRKLIALHHVDVPWRPSDIEQREGRILRQGNENAEVEIYNYVTKNSFDAYMWQTILNKLTFINQVMSGEVNSREAEDVSDLALSSQEAMALASGNPLIKEKFEVESEIRKTETLLSAHKSAVSEAKDIVEAWPGKIRLLQEEIRQLEEDIKTRDANLKDKDFTITVGGKAYTDRKQAGEALIKLGKELPESSRFEHRLGGYGGFDIMARKVSGDVQLELRGQRVYAARVTSTGTGTIRSIEHALNGMEERIARTKQLLEKTQKELAEARERATEVSPHEERLAELLARLDEINTELGLKETDSTIDYAEGDSGEVVALARPTRRTRERRTPTTANVTPADVGIPTDELTVVEAVRGPSIELEGGTELFLTPQAASEIANMVGNALETVLRPGHLHKKGVLGEFDKRAGAGAFLKQYSESWRVIGHELGHRLTDLGFRGNRAELRAVAEHLYPKRIKNNRLKEEEGVAEFFRLWVVDPRKAAELAPTVTEQFEQFIASHDELLDVFTRIREMVDDDLAGTPIERGTRSIDFTYRQRSATIGDEYRMGWLDRALFQVFDITRPMRRLMQEAEKKGYDGIDIAKFMALTGGAREKARRTFTERATDHLGRYIEGRSLKTIGEEMIEVVDRGLKESDNKRLKQHSAFRVLSSIMAAYRYQERASRGFENNPMDARLSSRVIEQSRQMFPGLEELVKEYTDTLSNIILTKLETADMIDAATRQRIEEKSRYYIPTMYTARQPIVSGSEEGGRAARQPVKRYRGRQARVRDFLTASILKLIEVEQAIEYKRMMNAIEEALTDGKGNTKEGMGRFGRVIPQPKVPVHISAKNLASQLERFMDEAVDEDSIGDSVLTLFVAGDVKKEPIIINWHGNRKTYIELAPDIFEALMAMRPPQITATIKVLARIGSAQRYFALSNIRYLTNAIARDAFTAAILKDTRRTATTGAAATALSKTALALATLGKKGQVDTKLFDAYVTSGAFLSNAENVLRNLSRNTVSQRLMNTEARGWKRTAKGMFIRLLDAPGDILLWQEQMQRFPEFEAKIRELAEEHGIDPEILLDPSKEIPRGRERDVEKILVEAGYAASEVTVNFFMHGASPLLRNYLTPSIPLLHGALQGLYREGRAMVQQPGRTFLRMALYLVPITLASFMAMRMVDDEDESDIPSEMRDKYWFFPLPGRFRIAIAKPFTLALPINIFERFLDWTWRQDENARKPLEDLGNVFLQSMGIPMMPIWGETLIGMSSNRNSFGSMIVSMSDMQHPRELRYDATTSEIAKFLSSAIASVTGDPDKTISPKMVDYLIEGMLAGVGSGITHITSGQTLEERGTEKYPFLGSLLYGPTEAGSRIVNRFYSDRDKSNRLNNAAMDYFKRYRDTGKLPPNISEENLRLVQAQPLFREYDKVIKELRTSFREMQMDKSVPPSAKYKAGLRYKYFEKMAAGHVYGYRPPKPPEKAGITDEEILRFKEMLEARGVAALQREARTEGGASFNKLLLERLKQERMK